MFTTLSHHVHPFAVYFTISAAVKPSAGNPPWYNLPTPYRANRNHALLQENDLFHLLRIGKGRLIGPKP